MRLVRVLNVLYFDTQTSRFQARAFKAPKGKSGISVFDRECAEKHSTSVCAHSQKFYKDVYGQPKVLWMFERAALPQQCVLKATRSLTGDECHVDLLELSNKAREDFFRSTQDVEQMIICSSDGTSSTAQIDELLALRERFSREADSPSAEREA